MVGHQQEQLVQLHRDTISTSWGFRLQGGQEANAPLTVQRVFVGGVSDGKLHRGDVIVGIGGQNARGMYHSQAEEMIKGAGRDISFKVLRGGGGGGGEGEGGGGGIIAQNDHNSHQLPWQQQPSAPSWQQPSAPISAPSWQPATPPSWQPAAAPPWQVGPSSLPEDDYEQKSVVDLRRQFQDPPTAGRIQTRPEPGRPSYIPKRPVIVKKPSQYEALTDPGWVPGTSHDTHSAPRASRYVPLSPPVNTFSRHQQPSYATLPRHASEPVRHEPAEPPAWMGTLRSAGGPRLWEIQEGQSLVGGGARVPAPVKHEPASRPVYSSTAPVAGGGGPPVHNPRVQAARYGPGGAAPTYDQYGAEGVDSETARIAHLQYNTPIGLYSRTSAREALEGQTRGKAGYGTMQISGTGPSDPAGKIKPFDPAHSDVYRMIMEEDEVKKHGGVVYGTGPARQGASRPAAAPARPTQAAAAPASAQDEAHSARFYQLVHENDDQADQYTNIHPEHYHHPQPGVAAMRDVEGRFDDMGVSDF